MVSAGEKKITRLASISGKRKGRKEIQRRNIVEAVDLPEGTQRKEGSPLAFWERGGGGKKRKEGRRDLPMFEVGVPAKPSPC